MQHLRPQSIAILGRQPLLGVAELERLYDAQHIEVIEGAALLDIPIENIEFKRLGGTVKLGRIIASIPTNKWKAVEEYLYINVPKHLEHVPEGKFTLGISAYNLSVTPSTVNHTALAIKKLVKETGRPMRVVPNKEPTLNSAQVLHNKLTTSGAWELILICDGRRTLLAQTMFVQDIDAYAARDQARPMRDANIGMLPPKLAQIMINLSGAKSGSILWDPFCGTGVILQEALLMNLDVYGSDIDQRMVDYTKQNLDWLSKKYIVSNGGYPSMQYSLEKADATEVTIKTAGHRGSRVNAVVSETYLGRPLTNLPEVSELQKIIQDVNTILKKFLINTARQLRPDTQLSLAVPAWRAGNDFKHLPLLDHLTDMGYNYVDFSLVKPEDLIYWRPNQIVARQLLILKRI